MRVNSTPHLYVTKKYSQTKNKQSKNDTFFYSPLNLHEKLQQRRDVLTSTNYHKNYPIERS